MNENENDYSAVNIIELLENFWQHRYIILAFIVLMAAVMFIKVTYLTEDTYTASGVLYVSNQNKVKADTDSIEKSDIESARSLSTTYMETLKIRSFLMDVSTSTGGKYSWQQIKNMMSISAVNSTELLAVSVTANTPVDAYQIAENIVSMAPGKLTSTFSGGEVTIVDRVIFPSEPDDSGLVKNVFIGALIGAVLGALLVFLISYFDTKVHKAEDVTRRYDVSLLGEISQ